MNTNGNPKGYREYAQCKLLESLRTGRLYYAEFYVSAQWPKRQNNLGYTNNIGLLFTTQPVSSTGRSSYDGTPLLYPPQVNATHILRDLNWQKVSGYFTANESYQYLTIGNFFTDALTKFSFGPQNDMHQGQAAYYLIDDILVVPAE